MCAFLSASDLRVVGDRGLIGIDTDTNRIVGHQQVEDSKQRFRKRQVARCMRAKNQVMVKYDINPPQTAGGK